MADAARIALMDQALAEARADCAKLVAHLRAKFAEGDESQATADFVQGLLDSPRWDRLELASTLGAAVAAIARSHSTQPVGVPGENGDTWCCAQCQKLAEEGL